MIVSPYTSGTMQVNWRNELETLYKETVRDAIKEKWAATKIPADYLGPRQDIDHLLASVVWLHPRAPTSLGDRDNTARVGFYVPRNLRLIRGCDFVLSCIYPSFPSIDSAHEIGVAYALGKPVVTVDLTKGARDYAAWRAMSLVVLDSIEMAADYLLYQVQDFDTKQETDELNTRLNQTPVGDKLPV